MGEDEGEVTIEPAGNGGITGGEGDLEPITRLSGNRSGFLGGDSGSDGAGGGGKATEFD